MDTVPILPTDYQQICTLKSEELLEKFKTRIGGLDPNEVTKREKLYGLNVIHKRNINLLSMLLRQFKDNPLLIILIIATSVSYALGQQVSSYYIFAMILLSVFLGLWNEYSAEKTVDSLLKKISRTALVVRHDEKMEIPLSQLTIGDIVLLTEGNIIPADLSLIETKNLEINESVLTGESATVYKNSNPLKSSPSGISAMSNIAFMGTSVDTGSGKGVVIGIGKNTEFGKIAKSTLYIKPETDFQLGLANFGRLLVKVILIMTIAIFIINSIMVGRAFLESLLFALAIAVGLTPELLPVIVTVSLSHGAGKLAKKKVIAKQLISIENLGNMDILCTDKTGTLTEGNIELTDIYSEEGKKDQSLLQKALLCNSAFIHHKVIGMGIDAAIWKYAQKNNINLPQNANRVDEEPFDFRRKMMFSVITIGGETLLLVKGMPESILQLCNNGINKSKLKEKLLSLSRNGLRTIAIGEKKIAKKDSYSWDDVKNMAFSGYITFRDTPKITAKEALQKLQHLNVRIKVITGDNEIVTEKICREVGMNFSDIVTGDKLEGITDTMMEEIVEKTDVFARVTPDQKLAIISAAKRKGHTVGFLGDGINDIPSLRNSDVGISVNTAIDVAKEASSIVLLHKSLDVIAEGIMEGRRTFTNTIKYILMGTSSNFGNMFSAAGASFFLPFLPMTPLQILLTNGLYDMSQLSLPTDNVDRESLIKPRHWNINFIKDYMLFFGPISSLYDFLIFGIMIFIFHAQGALFQTGWFIESIATEILVVFVIRTSKTPFFLSKPSKWLAFTCLGIVATGIVLPFTPLSFPLGFVTPPPLYFIILIFLVLSYLFLVETLKKIFLKKYSF
ncbi:magnesium-translocating P-type ATPase [Patescibacteria group bacterium]|nr:magnesium-translocating P-type ATPase [Patescibacteria group bacterium]MCL5798363.1 magnesium-translocating P-type ATPase [Patescibacteria group bacterium]